MARRALIIGLGSNGYEVCERLMQRIEWEYGSLERTPWVKFLWFETAPFDAAKPSHQTNGFHLTVRADEFADLRDNSKNYIDSLDLPAWVDPRIMRVPNAIEDGAANIRMIGRLAFLFPRNLQTIVSQVRDRLDHLNVLTLAQAKAARGKLPDGTDPDITLDPQIWVYVVGTLCGGTCSGSFVDMGYLLHNEFKLKGYSMERVGIFSVPHPVYDNRIHRANVYAALTELNHYSSPGTTYTVQYPMNPGSKSVVTSERPYRYCYLVAPQGGTSRDYEQLKITTAQYLHTDIFLPNITERDGARSNTASQLTRPDLKGAPQQYFTFGLSAIEFPAYLVVQACSYKLCIGAFNNWMAPRQMGQSDFAVIAQRDLAISEKESWGRLEAVGDGETPLRERIRQIFEESLDSGAADASFLEIAEEQIRAAFGDLGTAHGLLPAGSIPDRIKQKNLLPVIQRYRAELVKHIQDRLLDINSGTDYCRQLLEYLDGWLGDRIKLLNAPEGQNNRNAGVDGARDSMEEARENIAICQHDLVLTIMGAGIGKSMAIRRHVGEYEAYAHDYFDWRMRSLLEPVEVELWTELQKNVRTLHSRLTHPQHGIVTIGKSLVEEWSRELRTLNETTPPINGKLLFEANQTVDEMYLRTWVMKAENPDTQTTPEKAEQIAKAAVLASWEELPAEGRSTKGLFETFVADMDVVQLKARVARSNAKLLSGARDHFQNIFGIDVFDRFDETDQTLIRDALTKSKVTLDVAISMVDRHVEVPQKRYGMAFFRGATNAPHAAGTPQNRFYNTLEQLQGLNGFRLTRDEMGDGQSVIFLQERAAFSLPIVAGLREAGPASFAYDFENQNLAQTVHARRDVRAWEPPGGPQDPEEEERKTLILIGLAWPRGTVSDERLIRLTASPTSDARFEYHFSPPVGAGDTNVVLPDNLKSAAAILRQREQIFARLRTDIRQIRERTDPKILVQALERFKDGISVFNLKEGDSAVTRERVFNAFQEYFARDTSMMAAYSEIFKLDDYALNQLHKTVAQDNVPIDGYYCPCEHRQLLHTERANVSPRCHHCSRFLYDAGLRR